ncbi:hypothetical protein N4Z11_003659 [Salmonella enterica]|uniref:Uncharacterized protein n=1 Tax=Salmonella enterica TaxID=28901 RepID=A0A624WG93_SALER|nr:hypothetical protein [Salmonella enterica]EBQ7940049.1 hypothetical protein [Salmonella enterica]ECL8623311.1 hypothetical protein [Salmonella enterica]ECP5714639.1 hypothetical protein [Salmonella enterica]ECZ7313863.1 hypothetical protein [Salmonella enterica]
MYEVTVMKDNAKTSILVDGITISIGDIFHTCWGYEQTNVEFYQVVSLHGQKTVGLREIARERVEETSWCSADVRAVKDRFIDDDIFKRRIRVYGKDHVSVHFSDVTNAYRIAPDKTVHCSWGY